MNDSSTVATKSEGCNCTPLPIYIKCKLGTLGDLNAEFNTPTDFCLNTDDDIIIADMFNHRIQVFHKNGIFKLKFGVPGKVDGRLWQPWKVAVLRNDNRIIVSDQGVERWRLQIFSKNGIFIKKIPFYGIATLAAMAVTNDLNIVVVDLMSSSVFIIDENGVTLSYFEGRNYLDRPSDISVYDTEIFISDYRRHRVAVFSLDGAFRRYIGSRAEFAYPTGIYVTENDVFVSYCRGFKMNSDGDGFTVSQSHQCMFIMYNMSFK